MVAATRSRVFRVLDESSAPKTGVATASIRGSGHESITAEVSCNREINYNPDYNLNCAYPNGYPQSHVKRKPGRRPGKQNLSLKRCLNASLLRDNDIIASQAALDQDELVSQPVQQLCAAIGVPENPSTNLSPVQSTTAPSKLQNARRDFGASEVPKPSERPSTNTSSGQSSTPPMTLKFGMYAGRVKANPLKYLATVLRSKLQPHYEACNLLEVATEIHDEAKNKHNTTLRRIYDVVNVLEAAGLLERSNGCTPKRLSRTRSPARSTNKSSSTSLSTSAVEFGVDSVECQAEQIKMYGRNQTTATEKPRKLLEKRSTRGSRIRWLGSADSTEHDKRCERETLGHLSEEKIARSQRILEKQIELEYLQEELRLTTELIRHNQTGMYQSDCFESNASPRTPPPEDLSISYLNFEDCSPDCSQTSAETKYDPESLELQAVNRAALAAQDSSTIWRSWLPMSRCFDPGLSNSNISIQEDLDFWYNGSVSEVELNILESDVDEYHTNHLPLMNPGTARKGVLHTPFVALQTSSATNVEIELGGNLTSEVHIVLDNEYKLFDYRELLSVMFPPYDRDGSSPPMDALT